MVHQSVLLKEVLAGIAPNPTDTIVDATANRGGHGLALAKLLGPTGHLVGLDVDQPALAEASRNLKGVACRLNLILGNFRQLDKHLADIGVTAIDACVFDLGLSSEQLADPERGFSFQTKGPLLMTFSGKPDMAFTAEEIVNGWAEENLFEIFKRYGEEQFARSIARAIVTARASTPLRTTDSLVAAIRTGVPNWYANRRLHYATKTFQALRIAVNDELRALEEGLAAAWRILRLSGRLGVITFHGLEARLVKKFFRARHADQTGRPETKHVIKPSRAEILANPRARSATLRLMTKIHS